MAIRYSARVLCLFLYFFSVCKMLRFCVTLAVMGCVLAGPEPRAQHQYQTQQAEAIPPHLLRQYLADQGPPAQTQVIPRATQIIGASPPAARFAYATQQDDGQYRPQPQYQPQPQPQPQYRPQPQYQAQPQKQQPEDYDPNPSYQFGFDVNDDQFTNYQNRKEQREGDVIKGSYSVVDSDGFIRTVTYTADPKEGFKAEVSRQPTDIVVKVPTPKPQTQQPQYRPQPQQPQYQPQYQPQAQPRPQPQQYQPQAQPRPQPQQQQTPQQYYHYEQ